MQIMWETFPAGGFIQNKNKPQLMFSSTVYDLQIINNDHSSITYWSSVNKQCANVQKYFIHSSYIDSAMAMLILHWCSFQSHRGTTAVRDMLMTCETEQVALLFLSPPCLLQVLNFLTPVILL